ncbi:MAG: formyl transferase [Bacteroidota bacterium]
MKQRLLIFTSRNRSGKAVFNALRSTFPEQEIQVVKETTGNKRQLLKRRIQKQGLFYVINQLVFQILIVRALNFLCKRRIYTLQQPLDFGEIPAGYVKTLGTINDVEVLDIVKDFKPDLIIVSGTRIIKKRILNELPCEIVNIHAGITPEYRGVHGMYWALHNQEPELAGVTLHRVDTGIDTGAIISQARCTHTRYDSFVTYPFIQFQASIELLVNFVAGKREDEQVLSKGVKGPLYYHPTATSYLYHLITKRVR